MKENPETRGEHREISVSTTLLMTRGEEEEEKSKFKLIIRKVFTIEKRISHNDK